MTDKAYLFLEDLINSEYNSVMTELLFTEHQRTLPVEHRKIDPSIDDAQIGQHIFLLKSDLECIGEIRKALVNIG